MLVRHERHLDTVMRKEYLLSLTVLYITLVFSTDVVLTQECNSDVTVGGSPERPQGLTVPDYENTTDGRNFTCWWRLQSTDAEKSIVLEVVNPKFQQNTRCGLETLTVYAADSNASPQTIIARLCGSNFRTVWSNGQYMFVEFQADQSQSGDGFDIQVYQTYRCQQDLIATQASKSLFSPGYPVQYYNDMQCFWNIRTDVNSTVILDVVVSDIEASPNCQKDYLVVYNTGTTEVLGRMCGRNQQTIQSSRNYIRVEFHTGSNGTSIGFQIVYRAVAWDTCHLALHASDLSMYIVSPGFPNAYYNNLLCVWNITGDGQRPIELYVEVCNVEGPGLFNCPNDYIEIDTKRNDKIEKRAFYCGSFSNMYDSGTGDKIVRLKTNPSIVQSGFRMRYRFTPYVNPNATLPYHPSLYCGKYQLTATQTYKYLMSPNYPNSYQNHDHCIWIITAASSASMVRLEVEDSHMEYQEHCLFDYVRVYDGGSRASKAIQIWCGEMTPVVQSSGPQLTLEFRADSYHVYKGFKLRYIETEAPYECGTGLLAGIVPLILISPGYPLITQRIWDCQWTISSVYETNVTFTFVDTNLNSTMNCTENFVEIREGDEILITYCDDTVPDPVTSSGPNVTVIFHTSNVTAYRGFYLQYSSRYSSEFTTQSPTTRGHGCGASYYQATWLKYYLFSPNYPRPYDNNQTCVWTIEATNRRKMVRIVVLNSEMEEQEDCNRDFVEVFDGSTVNSPAIQIWCGNMTPTVQSTGRTLTLKFKTDGQIVKNGFMIQYFATSYQLICGDTLNASSVPVALISPGYPLTYQRNVKCDWTIRSLRGTNMRIIFVEISMLSDENCQHSYVQVDDVYSSPKSLLGRFCATQAPTLVSSSNRVVVTFYTGNSTERLQGVHRGFKLQYSSGQFKQCGRSNLRAVDGYKYITSPNYPFNYPTNIDCSWRLQTIKTNYVILMNVTTSFLPVTDGCQNNYVQVYDGYDESYPSLGMWCGTDKPRKQSSGKYLYIKFHTESTQSAKGFQIAFRNKIKDMPPVSRSPQTAVVIGSTIGAIAFIGILMIVGAVAIRKSYNRRRSETESYYDKIHLRTTSRRK